MKFRTIGKMILMGSIVICSLGSQVFAAEIGKALIEPESGWQRFDDDNSIIEYGGGADIYPYSESYDRSTIRLNSKDAYVKFNFYGTKLRIIGANYENHFTKNIKIEIDGVVDEYDAKDKGVGWQLLQYEKTGLEKKDHSVKIYREHQYIPDEQIHIDAIDINEDGELKPYSEIKHNFVLDLEAEEKTIKVKDTVDIDLVIDNIDKIAAEDIRIEYDEDKLEFLGFDEVDGMKLVKSIEETGDGELRVIVASEGEDNIVDDKEILLKLEFKGIEAGEALVDITNGRVTDGIEMEKDLTDEECGEVTIIIEELSDVNNSGEYTLLDLGIDARHFSKDPTSESLKDYNTDVVENGEIDQEDLLEIAKYILENKNYEPNKYN